MTDEFALLSIAALIDLAIGEPPGFFHPVVWMGHIISLLDRLSPKAGAALQFLYGTVVALVVPGVFAAATFFALHDTGRIAFFLVGTWLLKSTFAVRELALSARRVRDRLQAQDIESARTALKSLVRRDTQNLSPEHISSAAIESVAENTTDSFVAPWFYFALFGVPGAMAYRAINTLDGMLGHHGRYEYLGKASARLDDLVNLVPARIAGCLLVLGSALTRLNARNGWHIMLRDHGRTESPNAGWTMSAMAGALGVQLEKPGHYTLGDASRTLTANCITDAVRAMLAVVGLSFALSIAILGIRYLVVQAF